MNVQIAGKRLNCGNLVRKKAMRPSVHIAGLPNRMRTNIVFASTGAWHLVMIPQKPNIYDRETGLEKVGLSNAII